MTNITFNTEGKGLWSNTAKAVSIVDIDLTWCSEDKEFGELCVYFDTRTWDVDKLGLIYTDCQFMQELQEFLTAHGLLGDDVSYSEQGMQGDEYVSCDVGEKFIASWAAKFGDSAVESRI